MNVRSLIIVLSAIAMARPAALTAQVAQQTVDGKVATLTKELKISPFQQSVDDHFLKRIADATHASMSLDAQDHALDRIRADLQNTIRAHGVWQQKVEWATALTTVPFRLKTNLVNRVTGIERIFPDTAAVTSAIRDFDADYRGYTVFLDSAAAFRARISASNASTALQGQAERRLESVVGGLSQIQNDWRTFADEKNDFRNNRQTEDQYVSLEAMVKADDIPTAYTSFRTNSLAEITRSRADLGNSRGAVGYSHYDAMKRVYEQRRAWVRTLAQIQTGLDAIRAKKPAVRPSLSTPRPGADTADATIRRYQERHDAIKTTVVNYRVGGVLSLTNLQMTPVQATVVDAEKLRTLADSVSRRSAQ